MMRKAAIAAGAIAVALMAYQPAPAVADTIIQFSFPGGSVGVGDGRSRHRASRVSCRQARSIVRDNGFRDIDTIDCDGDSYRFQGWRHGDRYRISLDAWSGQITKVRRRH